MLPQGANAPTVEWSVVKFPETVYNVLKMDVLIECLKQNLPAILDNRPVMVAYLYGSVADGCPTPQSDVDIALVCTPDSKLKAYDQMMMDLEIEIAIAEACDVHNADVRTINDAPIQIQGHVLTTGQLLYSKDEDFRVAYEVRTRKRYFDFQPVLKMMQAAYFERLEEKSAGLIKDELRE